MGETVVKPISSKIRNFKDYTGYRSGRLVAIEPIGVGKRGAVIWRCKCDCGGETQVSSGNLGGRSTRSCGCLDREHLYNELIKKPDPRYSSRIHNSWVSMLDRCENPNAPHYDRYGGRGIKVCDEWHDFLTFYDWATNNGHVDGLTLERINNDGDYTPDNVRWATRKEQAQNRSTNRMLTFNGETHNVTEWSKITGINVSTIHARIRYGFPIERILFKGDYNGADRARRKKRIDSKN